MATGRKAFYTSLDNEGPKPYVVIEGVRWIEKQGQDAIVVVATLDNLSLLNSSLGPDRVRRLQASETVLLGNSVRLTAATERKMVHSWPGPMLVLYPAKELLDKVDSIIGVTSVLVVPWLKADVQDWIRTWGAEELSAGESRAGEGGANESGPGVNSGQGILRAALSSLSRRVNVSTGLSHPGDKAAAIELFTILRDARIPCEAEEVKSLLLSLFAWSPQQANQVRDLVADLQAGKRPRKHKGYDRPLWNPNIFQLWREEAQAAANGSGAEP